MLSQHHGNLVDWPSPDIVQLDDKVGRQYRKLALELYAAQVPFPEIKGRTGLSADEVRRPLRRCTSSTHDGSIVGLYALLPAYRIAPYRRKKPLPAYDPFVEASSGDFSSALRVIFERFPDIKKAIDNEWRGSRKSGGATRNRKKLESSPKLGLERYR